MRRLFPLLLLLALALWPGHAPAQAGKSGKAAAAPPPPAPETARPECKPAEADATASAAAQPDDGFDEYGPIDLLANGVTAGAAQEAQPSEPSDGSAPAGDPELQVWRETAARYEDRAKEFAGEVSRIIRRKYDAEASALKLGYERLVGQATIDEKMLREEAIRLHESFIKDHVSSPYTARRMFRLAELYFEESDEKFAQEDDKYRELNNLFDQGKLDYLPEPPVKDYRKPVALYKKIISSFPDYEDLGAVYYMLGYCYSDEQTGRPDPEKASQTYLALIENVPSSPYRAQAYFRLADLYFEENQLQRALAYYAKILEEVEASRVNGKLDESNERLYELSLYKLAWAYYKVDDLEVAIQRFMELLDWAEEKEARTGVEADLKPESVRYLAISLGDRALDLETQPIDFAVQQLAIRSARPWMFSVLVELAGILKDQARFEEAIAAYQRLQEIQPNHPLGPEFQNNVIVLYQNLPVPDTDAAAQARVDLTLRYGLDSQWYQSNKNNKEATASATQYILDSLQRVAYTYHDKAQKSGLAADYMIAAKRYEEYLERFPFAKEAYELNYFLADCYFWIGAEKYEERDGRAVSGWEKAIEQYVRLFGFPETQYRKAAVQGIMLAYNNTWKASGEDVTKTPEALANLQPPLGQTVSYSAVALNDLEKNYIRSVRWIQKENPAYENLSVVLYDLGQIYYYKNHLDRARRVFEEIIKGYPQTDYASFAAGLIVDSWRYTGNLGKMREATERFAMMELGADPELRSTRNLAFADLARSSLFKDGELSYVAENYECALAAFLEYYDKYGAEGTDADPKNMDLVVYNVAQSYSKIGLTSDSNLWFELLLDRFPHSVQAPATFWKMAGNYEKVLDLSKAIRYYEDLIAFHPDHKDAAAALLNSGFLHVGLKHFDQAAMAYEKYHQKYTTEADAKLVLFRAGETWETAGNRKNAKRVYEQWLKEYGEEDADRWVETQFKLQRFLREDGKVKDADKLLKTVGDACPAMKEKLGGIGKKICAEYWFQPLLADFKLYEALTFPNTQNPDELKKVTDEKIAWNQRVAQAMDQFIVQWDDFEWQTAALYYKGLSYKRHGESWLQAPVPFNVDNPDEEELYYTYVDLLSQQAAPFEQAAIEGFKKVVDFATQKKRHTKWVDEALKELNRTDPNTYPVPKPERSTVVPSDGLVLPPAVDTLPEASLRPADDGIRFAYKELR
jgi:tetratricopeptide (TPR) repeat protein